MSIKESSAKKRSRITVRDMVLIALFTALITVCAWITVPIPGIPFTLQIFGVFAALFVLGGRKGTISVCLYLLLGAIGVPVFSGFRAGISQLLGTTGGYLIGFIFSGLVYWLITSLMPRKDSPAVMILSAAAALIVCYLFGTVWFMIVYLSKTGSVGLWTVLMWCVIPYIIPDVIKIALAMMLSKILKKTVKI